MRFKEKQALKEDASALVKLAIQMWEDNEIEELAMQFEEANRVICFRKNI